MKSSLLRHELEALSPPLFLRPPWLTVPETSLTLKNPLNTTHHSVPTHHLQDRAEGSSKLAAGAEIGTGHYYGPTDDITLANTFYKFLTRLKCSPPLTKLFLQLHLTSAFSVWHLQSRGYFSPLHPTNTFLPLTHRQTCKTHHQLVLERVASRQ